MKKVINLLIKCRDYAKNSLTQSMFKKKVGNEGIIYAGHAIRYFGIIVDCLILMLALHVVEYVSLKILPQCHNLGKDVTLEMIEKVRLGMELNSDETIAVNAFKGEILSCKIPVQLIEIFFTMASFWFVWKRYNATPSNIFFKTRLVDAKSMEPINFKRALKRFGWSILSLLPACLGFLWIIFDKRGQSWHDKITDTVVIKV